MSLGNVYAHCNCCGRTYDDRVDYLEHTSYVGTLETGGLFEYDLELRNCSCGSTLSAKTPALESRSRQVSPLVTKNMQVASKNSKA